MPPGARTDYLKRRNALWQQLRAHPPGSAPFEAALRDLSSLTGWPRECVLAGLGLTPDEVLTGPGEA